MPSLSPHHTPSTALPRRQQSECKNVCYKNNNESLISIYAPHKYVKYTNHKFLLILFLYTMALLLTGSSLPTVGAGTNPRIPHKPPRTEPGECRSIDVRNDCETFQQLHNCTIIRGFLLMVLVPEVRYKTKEPCYYENYTFPLLREITDFVIFHDVRGLRSIRHFFPNLAVIRGRRLFMNYALGITRMPDLQTVSICVLFTYSTFLWYSKKITIGVLEEVEM